MGPAAEQLIQAALALPKEGRQELVEALLDSLAPSDQPPFDKAWLDEVRGRSAEVKTGGVHLDSWQVVRDRVRGSQS